MNRASIVGVLVLIAGGIAMYFASRGAPMPLLQPAGPIAAGQLDVIVITVALASIIVVPVFVLLFYFAWKYRSDSPISHAHHHPNWDHDNAIAEFIWWLGPTIIIAILAVVAWQSSHALDPYVPIEGGRGTLEVQVVALNWKWLFIYPELGIAAVNELTIPEDVPVHFSLTADAPMNAFWVPQLGGMIMVMPGMNTQIHLAADRQGLFDGFSGNLSGKGFSGMAFKVRSVSADTFAEWAIAVSKMRTALTAETYTELARSSENHPVEYYSGAHPDLYNSIYMKYMTPTDESHAHQ